MRALSIQFLLVLIVLLPVTEISAQRQHQGSNKLAAEAVGRVETKWLAALVEKDIDSLQQILADDYMITFEDGGTRNKAETLMTMRASGPADPTVSNWTENSVVRVYSNAAVVTGIYVFRDKNSISRSRYTDTYIRRDRRWQVVASHLSPIKAPGSRS